MTRETISSRDVAVWGSGLFAVTRHSDSDQLSSRNTQKDGEELKKGSKHYTYGSVSKSSLSNLVFVFFCFSLSLTLLSLGLVHCDMHL